MVRHTFKILQQTLQNFSSASDHFGTLCSKRLNVFFQLWAIETFKYHPKVLKTKEFLTDKGMPFSFSYTTQEKSLQNLGAKKTCQENDSL